MSPNTDPPAIPYSRPKLGEEEEAAVLRVMRSGWLTTGEQSRRFEEEFAEAADPGAGLHALAVSSATAGLHIGLRALDLPKGSHVALSPYTFAASINSILYNGLRPELIDCIPGGYHLDPKALDARFSRRLFGRRIRALMPVHFAGWEEAGPELEDIAARRNLVMIEDAAHSFPARRLDAPSRAQGTRGRLGVFSFYANKTITTGEGGMIITSDGDLAGRIAKYRLHGISRAVWDRYTAPGSGYRYDIEVPGYKYNMPDILSAMGRVQLERAGGLMDARRSVARRYAEAFADRDWISPPPGVRTLEAGSPDADAHSWHIYSLRLRLGRLTVSRDEFIAALAERGIGTSVHFIPLHTMTYYAKRFGYRPADFPNALASFEASISLPIFPGLGDDEVRRVIDEVLEIGDTHYRGSF
jgi:dTDP-4-amino-4,6-dideoxygalactose transaminase